MQALHDYVMPCACPPSCGAKVDFLRQILSTAINFHRLPPYFGIFHSQDMQKMYRTQPVYAWFFPSFHPAARFRRMKNYASAVLPPPSPCKTVDNPAELWYLLPISDPGLIG